MRGMISSEITEPCVGDVTGFRTIEFLCNNVDKKKGGIIKRRSDFKVFLFKPEKFNHPCKDPVFTVFTNGGIAYRNEGGGRDLDLTNIEHVSRIYPKKGYKTHWWRKAQK